MSASLGRRAPSRASTIVRWRARAAWRRLLFRTFHSREGRLALAVCLVAVPGFVGAMIGDGLPPLPAGRPGSRAGMWVLAYASALACVCLLVPPVVARKLVLDAERDPLRAHPAALGTAAGITGAVVSVGCALYVSAFIMIFHGRMLASSTGFVFFAAVGCGTLGTTVLLASGVCDGARRFLRGACPSARALLVRRWCSPPFLVAFLGLALAPEFLSEQLPRMVEGVGSVAASLRAPPMAGGGVLAWVGLGTALTILAPLSLVVRWREMDLGELALIPHGMMGPDGTSTPPRIPRIAPNRPWRFVRLLRAKDRCDRTRVGTVALWAGAVTAAGMLLSQSLPETAVGLSLPALLALPHLTWLGREAEAGDLLVLELGPAPLLALRFVASWITVGAGAALGIVVLLVTVATLGLGAQALPMTAAAVCGTTVFVGLAIGIGALLPDSEGRSFLFPGATRAAVFAYLVAASAVVGIAAYSVDGTADEALVRLALSGSMAFGVAVGFGYLALGRRTAEWRP